MSPGTLVAGSTIGIIGGGQLGRMLAIAAARLGYKTVILEPQADCPAAQVANAQIVGAYDDLEALERLASAAHIITYEFENVPVGGIAHLARSVPVFPPPRALEVSQDRLTEKRFFNDNGIATADFRTVDSDDDLESALAEFSGRGVLKTRRFGYDGKGQRVFTGVGSDSIAGTFQAMGGVPLILESLVSFEREISIIAARASDGTVVTYDPAENRHENGILSRSSVPAAISSETARLACDAAAAVLKGLDYRGVIGIEFFLLADGSLIANEMAPRVHNSGHWTEAACAVSQFENHIRAIAGLPLGATGRHSDCDMHNLIGADVEKARDWMMKPDCVVHLYGKAETRAGRKMGHVTQLRPIGRAIG